MLERDIVAAVKRYLSTLGEDVFFWKEHGGPYGTSGIPDIIICYKGRFIGMECKLPGGRLTELQKRAIAKINRAGGIARRPFTRASYHGRRRCDYRRRIVTTMEDLVTTGEGFTVRVLNA